MISPSICWGDWAPDQLTCVMLRSVMASWLKAACMDPIYNLGTISRGMLSCHMRYGCILSLTSGVISSAMHRFMV